MCGRAQSPNKVICSLGSVLLPFLAHAAEVTQKPRVVFICECRKARELRTTPLAQNLSMVCIFSVRCGTIPT
jgi:hypothetical protein